VVVVPKALIIALAISFTWADGCGSFGCSDEWFCGRIWPTWL